MSDTMLCDTVSTGLGELFSYSRVGEFTRIRTPYLYPDGDNIDLYCKVEADVTTVSDLAETSRWLRMQTLSPHRTIKQRQLIEDLRLTHGVEYYKGMLTARCQPGSSLAAVVTRVAQAALRMSDLWFTFRTRSVESIADEVGDFLAERDLSFERSEKLMGRSGRSWNVDFHVRTASRSSLVYVLSTGNRSAAHAISEHVVAAWYDLNQLAAGPEALRFVSLFDDTMDVWNDEDYELVSGLSTVARWSRPDEFADMLVSVA